MMKETKCSHRLQTRSLCLRCLVPVLHTFALGVLPWAAFYVFACVAFGSRRRATAGEIVSAPSNFWSIFWSSTGPRPQRVGNVSVTPAVFGQHFSTEAMACCEPFGGPQKIKSQEKNDQTWGLIWVWHGMTMSDRTHWIKQMVSVFLLQFMFYPWDHDVNDVQLTTFFLRRKCQHTIPCVVAFGFQELKGEAEIMDTRRLENAASSARFRTGENLCHLLYADKPGITTRLRHGMP